MPNWTTLGYPGCCETQSGARGAEYQVLGHLLFRKHVFVVKLKGLVSNI